MKYNKNVKKYINDCKYLFASYGKSEKEYMNKLIENIVDGSHDITYDEILERLGTPKETIINYYNQKDMEILIQKAKIKNFLIDHIIQGCNFSLRKIANLWLFCFQKFS